MRDSAGRPVQPLCCVCGGAANYAESDLLKGDLAARWYCRKCLPAGFLPGTAREAIPQSAAPAKVEATNLFEWDGETK